MSTSQGTVEATPSATREANFLVTCSIGELENSKTNPNYQPKRPYPHNQPRCSSDKLCHLDAETSQKHHAHAIGTTQYSKPIPERSTSSVRPIVQRAHLQGRQKMVSNTRGVHWSWHPQPNGKTSLWQDSQFQGTGETGSNYIRRTTANLPLTIQLGHSQLNYIAKQRIKQILNKNSQIFARHRLDKHKNTGFKIKLSPNRTTQFTHRACQHQQ